MRVAGLLALAVVLASTAAWGAGPLTLAERAVAIERASQAPDGFRVVVGRLSRELGLPVEDLRAQRLRTGLDWGALLIANRLARETGLTLDQVVMEYRGGKAWEDLVREHKVDLQKLISAVEQTQTVVERRSEDKAPPPMESKGSAPPGTSPGGFVPGIMPAPTQIPGRQY